MKNSPVWFKFYPRDWTTDINVVRMTCEQRGAYIQLLCYQAINGGLPADDESLAVLSGMGERWNTCSAPVKQMFEQRGSLLFNRRLSSEIKKYNEISEKKRQAGIISGKARNNKDISSNRCSTDVQHVPNNTDTDTEAEKEAEKENKKLLTTFVPTDKAPSVATPLEAKPIFNYTTQSFENISDTQIQKWKEAYPAVDINSEMLRAGQWLAANPAKRKKDIRRFVNNWLSRKQERGGSIMGAVSGQTTLYDPDLPWKNPALNPGGLSKPEWLWANPNWKRGKNDDGQKPDIFNGKGIFGN